jgi:S-ribosylhomocysteine lyase LuxS involved in autoinducer biosynthesis
MSNVPYIFAGQTGPIPLVQLDVNFANVKAFANTAGYVTANAQANITSVGTLTSLSVSGNITGGNQFSVAGNITTNNNILIAGLVSATGNITAGNITTGGTFTNGNITLVNANIISAGPTLYIDPNGAGGTDGTVIIAGNLTVQGTTTTTNSNTITTNDLQINMANNAATSSQANNGGIGVGPTGGEYATLLFNNAANSWYSSIPLSVVGTVQASGNVTAGNLITSGAVRLASIINANANGVGNIGSSTGYFNTIFAKATSAEYADIAENYLSDAKYEPGTVLSFDGIAEVTQCNTDSCTSIAGVVSTNPAYQMNSGLTGDFVTTVALLGRVPCKVQGPIIRGSLLVSAGNGRARSETNPKPGSIIGKALTSFDDSVGTIEIVVGRL